MSFKDGMTADGKKWKVIKEIASIKKNSADTIKIQKCELGGVEYGHVQTWHTGKDGNSTPVKGKNVTFRIELKDDIVKALQEL